MRAPFKGWEGPYCKAYQRIDSVILKQSQTFFLKYMRPGISFFKIDEKKTKDKTGRQPLQSQSPCDQRRREKRLKICEIHEERCGG